MADIFDKATRSRIMRAIKGKNTGPERALHAALRSAGVRVRRHVKLPGRPDFVVCGRGNSFRLPGALGLLPPRLAVFVHGCFWHLCPRHYKAPAGAGWRRKMDGNRRRDIRVRRKLRRLGWRTMVVWEHEDMARAAQRVRRRALRGE